MTESKIDNRKLARFNTKPVKEYIREHIVGSEDILDHIVFSISTRRPPWDKSWKRDDKGDRLIVVGGVDIKIEPRGVGHYGPDPLRFGVRTTDDGLIDLAKLTHKFKEKLPQILEKIAQDDENMRIRQERRDRCEDGYEVLRRLAAEHLIRQFDYIPMDSGGFKTEIILMDEDEIRFFASFKNELLAAREEKA